MIPIPEAKDPTVHLRPDSKREHDFSKPSKSSRKATSRSTENTHRNNYANRKYHHGGAETDRSDKYKYGSKKHNPISSIRSKINGFSRGGFDKKRREKSSRSVKFKNKDIPAEYLSNNKFYRNRAKNKSNSHRSLFEHKKSLKKEQK